MLAADFHTLTDQKCSTVLQTQVVVFMKDILRLVSYHTKTITSTQPNISSSMFQHWPTMHLMLTMWSIGRSLQFWTENCTQVPDRSKKHQVFGKRDDDPWTGTRNKLLLTNVSGRDQKVQVKCWLCWSNRLLCYILNLNKIQQDNSDTGLKPSIVSMH